MAPPAISIPKSTNGEESSSKYETRSKTKNKNNSNGNNKRKRQQQSTNKNNRRVIKKAINDTVAAMLKKYDNSSDNESEEEESSEEEEEENDSDNDSEEEDNDSSSEEDNDEKENDSSDNDSEEEDEDEESSEDEEEDGSEEDDNEDDDEEMSRPIIVILTEQQANGHEGGECSQGLCGLTKEYNTMSKASKSEKCSKVDEKVFMGDMYTSSSALDKLAEDDDMKAAVVSPVNKGDIEQNNDKDLEHEYNELVQLKISLASQFKNGQNNQILKNAIHECNASINELIKTTRDQNTKTYYDLVVNAETANNKTSELVYFKTKCSQKEQQKITSDLSFINKLTYNDKPYRLSLLELSDISPVCKSIVLQKIKTLQSMDPSANSEYYKLKHWVDGFMRVPFGKYDSLGINISSGIHECQSFLINAKSTLDNCVYGLDDAKLQIMQMMGQWITNPDAMGSAIAIKGPMGTGKTTLVKEGISKILGREFAFIALGGARDGSFLEGHNYTYEGSSWGKILQILMDTRCMNPVIYFDELDKISNSPHGEEITNILIHLTDVTQNDKFHDKYFGELTFPLNKCLFIFSYNDETKVNPILLDRMYSISTKGYSTKEKVIIARNHLLPKIQEQVKFSSTDIVISDEVLQYIITNTQYCGTELGVRNLKRCLEIIYTKLNLFRLVPSDNSMFSKDINLGTASVQFPFTVTKDHIRVLIKPNEDAYRACNSMYV